MDTVKKCIVKNCTNSSNAGIFVGDLCSPCNEFITTNRGNKHSQAYRNAMEIATNELRDMILQFLQVTKNVI